MISTEARVAFLRRIHLFHVVKDEELAVIAGQLKEESWVSGMAIFVPGAEADRFFIIHRGAVRVTEVEGGQAHELATLIAGDYFGEEALLVNHKRSATVSAVENSEFLTLTRDSLNAILKKFPKLRSAFEVSFVSRRLARKMHFDWQRPDEVIYFLARKHEVVLAQALSGPVVSLSVPLVLLAYFMATRSFFAIFGAGVLFVGVMAWGLWNWIDWGNDYYIVTNDRVVWLEKVIGLYDSRQEAPLTTVLSVGVETDMAGRFLDYGNVIVRTYVGKIPFSHVAHPYEASHIVEEQWTRTKRSASRLEKEAMRNVLRQKMGLALETKVDEARTEKGATPTFYRRSILKTIGGNWFKLRTEDGGTITYRKHWFVLWRQVWQPTVLIFMVGIGILARLNTLARTPGQTLLDVAKTIPIDTWVLALLVSLFPVFIWWIYQYIDWRNDIFQVTPDQILDVDKKPFGSEARRAAPLENILSTESERVGLAGYLLNFGTVYITVGGAHLDFEDVLDPTAVQADIDRRRENFASQKQQAEADAERERMAEWLVAYHENESELRQHEGTSEADQENE